MLRINDIIKQTQIIPNITITNPRDAVPLVRTLLTGGMSVVQINGCDATVYTAIQAIRTTVPQAIVGVSNIINRRQIADAKESGAQFAVSPGVTPTLASAAKTVHLPLLPGVVTPSEIMLAHALGFDILQFYPAESLGGLTTLKAYARTFPLIKFVAAGGITRQSLREYLTLDNVIAVEANWIAPNKLIEEQDWTDISTLARESLVTI